MTPEEYCQEYLDLYVDTLKYRGPGKSPPIEHYMGEFVCVDGYRSGYPSKARTARKTIKDWLEAKAALPGSGIEMLQHRSEWRITGTPWAASDTVTDDMILKTVNGKGKPETIAIVLQVVSMMTTEDQAIKGLLGADHIYDFVKFFVGVDCNGFIANYIQSRNPAHKHLDVNDYKTPSRERKSLAEMKPLDLMFPASDQRDHIAIISEIKERTDKRIVCTVSESRGGSFGGVQTREWKVFRKGDAFAMNRGGADRACGMICGHPDLDGFA
jgi:hypothetical protein